MVHVIGFVLTFWIFPHKVRALVRRRFINLCYNFPVRRRAKCVGKKMRCRGVTFVNRKTEIGDDFHTGGMIVHGTGEVKIGKHVHAGWNLRVFTRSHDYNHGDKIPYGKGYMVKGVEIGDCVWIGAEVILLPGTRIGEGAIIQAGSVVHGVIPPLAIAGGNPAKVFAERDREHYETLKAQGQFN